MQTHLHHLVTGVHASVYAYRRPDPSHVVESAGSTDIQGLPGWGVVKIVRAGPSGKSRGLKPHNVLREVLALQKAQHPNVVQVIDYAWSENVWEHQIALPLLAITLRTVLDTRRTHTQSCDNMPDLAGLSLTRTDIPLSEADERDVLFRSIAFQLLVALAYLHGLRVAHRDIKPDNIMLDWDGRLVLIDLGIAWDEDAEDWGGEWKEGVHDMCCDVGSGPYRAPELLFAPTSYDPFALDLWAAGCVLSEFFTPLTAAPTSDLDLLESMDDHPGMDDSGRRPLFDATYGDLGLASSVFGILGTPTSTNWPSFSSLPDAGKMAFEPRLPRRLRDVLPDLPRCADAGAIENLISSLLVLDPSRRTSAEVALKHEVFDTAFLLPVSALGQAGYAEGHAVLHQIGGVTLDDLLSDLLSSARRRWELLSGESL